MASTCDRHNRELLFRWLSLLLFLSIRCRAQRQGHPTECDRGVKRPHPSQANVYQVFTRQNLKKNWLDYSCPEFSVFDPGLCRCVEDQKPEHEARQRARPTKSRRGQESRSEVDHPPRSQQRFQQEGNKKSERRPSPRTEWPAQQKKPADDRRKRPPVKPDREPPKRAFDQKQADFQERDKSIQEPSGPPGNQQEAEADCYLHRPTGDPSLFERWSDGEWVQEDCNWPFYTGLMWNQVSCRCEWGPNRTFAVPMIEDTVPAACLMMLKISFDAGDIKDEGRHIWLNVKNKDAASVVSDSTAVGGKCGQFRGASIAVPYFKSNVLGSVFHIGFMFKLCPGDPDTDIPLVHNDCIESGQDGPSIAVVYQAWKKHVIVSMKTENSDKLISEYCDLRTTQVFGPNVFANLKGDLLDVRNLMNLLDERIRSNYPRTTQWTKLDIRYGENYLEIMANDEVCIASSKYHGPLATNNCPLSLMGEAFCGSMDEVIVTRGCTSAHAVS